MRNGDQNEGCTSSDVFNLIDPLPILIAGPSASGKSTLALEVAKSLGWPTLSLDDYYVRGAKAFVDVSGQRVRTFERPELYSGARLAADIRYYGGQVVAEGFCLLTYPEILTVPALRFYLDVAFAECLRRRLARRPRRPSDRHFQIVGETENAAVVAPQRDIPGIHVMDGSKPTGDLISEIVALHHERRTRPKPLREAQDA